MTMLMSYIKLLWGSREAVCDQAGALCRHAPDPFAHPER